jgi:hypothetical protein
VSGRRLRATARRPPPVSVTGATVSGPRPALARAPPPVGATRTTLSGNGQANPGAAARLRRPGDRPDDGFGRRRGGRLPFPSQERRFRDTTGSNAAAARLRRPDDALGPQRRGRFPFAPPGRRFRATAKPTRAPLPDCATRTTSAGHGAATASRFRHRSDGYGIRPAPTPSPPPVCATRTPPDDGFRQRPTQPPAPAARFRHRGAMPRSSALATGRAMKSLPPVAASSITASVRGIAPRRRPSLNPVVTISQFTVLHVLAPSCLLG